MNVSLSPKKDRGEFERLEQMIRRSAGDIAEALGRGLERLEEHVDDAEFRLAQRLAEVEDRLSVPAVGSVF